MSDPSPGEEELKRLKQAANTAEEATRWLRSSIRRVRNGSDLEPELHNALQAISDALATIREGPESSTTGDSAATHGEKAPWRSTP